MKDNRKAIRQEVLENFAKDLPPIYSAIVQHSNLSTFSWAQCFLGLHGTSFWSYQQEKRRRGRGCHAPHGTQSRPKRARELLPFLGQHFGDLCVLNKRLVAGEGICKSFERYAERRRWGTFAMTILSSFLCGFVEQSGGGLLMELLKKNMGFDRLFYKRVLGLIQYDCARLPCGGYSTSCLSNLDNEKQEWDFLVGT